MNSDRHTALCKSASDWIQVHVQGNIFLLLCIPCSPSLSLFFFYYELIMQLKAISAVFECLGLSKPTKSSRIKPRRASLSLFSLPSWGSILVIIIGSPSFPSQEFFKTRQRITIQTNFNQLCNLCLTTVIGFLVDLPGRQ